MRDKRFILFYLLDYEKNYPNVKIEFNKRIWKNNTYESAWLLGVEIKIANKATMFTNKLVAITEFLKKFIIKKFNSKNILESMGEVLNEKQKDWAKSHLISDTIEELDKFIKN